MRRCERGNGWQAPHSSPDSYTAEAPVFQGSKWCVFFFSSVFIHCWVVPIKWIKYVVSRGKRCSELRWPTYLLTSRCKVVSCCTADKQACRHGIDAHTKGWDGNNTGLWAPSLLSETPREDMPWLSVNWMNHNQVPWKLFVLTLTSPRTYNIYKINHKLHQSNWPSNTNIATSPTAKWIQDLAAVSYYQFSPL